jgi:hypothetical protein
MKKKFVLFPVLLLLAVFAGALASPLNEDADACWQKGVNAALLSRDHVPGKIHMIFERLDGDGKTREKNEMWLELPPGEKDARLVRALENGKDVTREELEKEKARKEKSKAKGKSDGENSINLSSEDIIPLLTNTKKSVAHKYLGRETRSGVECFAYEFRKEHLQKRGKKQETVFHQGKIWLDAASGMPVEAAYAYDPLPSMVKQMEMKTFFMAQGEKFFVRSHEMLIKAGFLFIKKRFRISFVLDGYREADKKQPAKP